MAAHPEPLVTPTSEPFWAGLREGRLLIQRCTGCGEYCFYPRVRCPACLSDGLEWRPIAVRGCVYTFAVCHIPTMSAFAGEAPQIVAVIELDAGPRLTSTIVDAAPDAVEVGARVTGVFDTESAVPLLRFRLDLRAGLPFP